MPSTPFILRLKCFNYGEDEEEETDEDEEEDADSDAIMQKSTNKRTNEELSISRYIKMDEEDDDINYDVIEVKRTIMKMKS